MSEPAAASGAAPGGRRGPGLQSQLLAGLAVLVGLAIASTGWITLEVTRRRLEAAEFERARTLGATVTGLLGASFAAGGDGEAAVRRTTAALATGGEIGELTVVDARQRPLAGDPGGDGRISAALGGATWVERGVDGSVTVFAPIRRGDGETAGALRLRLPVSQSLRDASRGSGALLAILTLVDACLILLFGALFVRQVVRPLEALGRASARVAEGDFVVPPLPPAPGEVGALLDAFRRMAAALAEQQRHLEASREQVLAQEKLATVGRLAAGIAHEIGNPLTAVLGYVDLLLLDERDAAARDLLERVKAETGRIHRIVHDLLDYARPVAEALEPVRWPDVLATAEGLLRPQPRFRNVALHNQVDPSLPPVAGSPRRLLQVALNLLLNAADATAGEGQVTVRGHLEGDRVVLEVEDSGPGVPAAARERLFDPFYSTKEPGAGTGLGLAVCRSIVEAFGGRIQLAAPSTPAGGALFRVTLPRAQPAAAPGG